MLFFNDKEKKTIKATFISDYARKTKQIINLNIHFD